MFANVKVPFPDDALLSSIIYFHNFSALVGHKLCIWFACFHCCAVLKGHKAVRCDSCDMWIHNECSFIAKTQYETVNNTNCTWICPKCEFFNFSDSFFGEQVNLETENRFVPLTK